MNAVQQLPSPSHRVFNHIPFPPRLVWIVCLTAVFATSRAQTNFQIIKSFGFPALSTGASPTSEMTLGTDGMLYGVTLEGGSNAEGVIYTMTTNGGGYKVLHSFGGSTNDGSYPAAELLQASDGMLYGTTESGGTNNSGVLFQINTAGTVYNIVHTFNPYTEGESPQAGLLQGREDGLLYGTTSTGGRYYGGTVFKVDTSGSSFIVLTNFTVETGVGSYAGLVEGVDGYLYGTTYSDGDYEGAGYNGGVFKLARDGTSFNVLHYFTYEPYDGDVPEGRLVQGSDGYLYGTCEQGGNPSTGNYSYIGNGTIYKIDTNSGYDYQIIYEFPTSGTNGAAPRSGLHFGSDGYLYGSASSGGSGKVGSLFKILPSAGSTPIIIHTFVGTDGSQPYAALVPDPSGSFFYGIAYVGGSQDDGTAFEVASDGSTFSVLHNFVSPTGGDGLRPMAPVSIYGNVVYGTTTSGAAGGEGAVFSMNLNGSGYQFLHSFTNSTTDGNGPAGALLKAADGFLYGTTQDGGTYRDGTIFKVSTNGNYYSVLWNFSNGPDDGAYPLAGLIQGVDGNLYGTTSEGGSNYDGTVFAISTNGGPDIILYNFQGYPDGSDPAGSLLQDYYGTLYGTTESGGTNDYGTLFSLSTNGNNYQVIYNFNGATNDGSNPAAGLLESQAGMLYGTTESGGIDYDGTVFAIATNRMDYAVLYSFTNGLDGNEPESQLVQGVNHLLYGTCSYGGANSDGTVFELTTNGTTFTILHAFSSQDCTYPEGGLALASDGSLWGAAGEGGALNYGAIYKLSSIAEVLNLASYGPTGITLDFSGGVPNQPYQILASTNLLQWTPIATNSSDATGSFQYLDTNTSSYHSRFYITSGP
jgi:uncharacterized repeat protein (TIGR03803 family)